MTAPVPCPSDLEPWIVMNEGQQSPYSKRFDIPEGGWAQLCIDRPLEEDETLCLFQVICMCCVEKVYPLCIKGEHIGIKAGCMDTLIPVSGTFYFCYTGADIDFDAVIKPYACMDQLNVLMTHGGC